MPLCCTAPLQVGRREVVAARNEQHLASLPALEMPAAGKLGQRWAGVNCGVAGLLARRKRRCSRVAVPTAATPSHCACGTALQSRPCAGKSACPRPTGHLGAAHAGNSCMAVVVAGPNCCAADLGGAKSTVQAQHASFHAGTHRRRLPAQLMRLCPCPCTLLPLHPLRLHPPTVRRPLLPLAHSLCRQ